MKKFENQFLEKLVQKKWKDGLSEKDAWINAAKDFGFLMADAEKSGLTRELAYLAAKNHFITYGKIMLEFGENVEAFIPVETITKEKTSAPKGDK